MRRRFLTKTGQWTNLALIPQAAEMNLGAFLICNKVSQISSQKNESSRILFCSLIWLGLQDSNLRMTGPKPVALPLGEGPNSPNFSTFSTLCRRMLY